MFIFWAFGIEKPKHKEKKNGKNWSFEKQKFHNLRERGTHEWGKNEEQKEKQETKNKNLRNCQKRLNIK